MPGWGLVAGHRALPHRGWEREGWEPGGGLASFLLALTFDLLAGDPELGGTDGAPLTRSKKTTARQEDPHSWGWTPAGLQRMSGGGRGSQVGVSGRKALALGEGAP